MPRRTRKPKEKKPIDQYDHKKAKRINNPSVGLVTLETEYRRHLWSKVEAHVVELLRSAGLGQIFAAHTRNLNKIKKFLSQDLKEFYEKIR